MVILLAVVTEIICSGGWGQLGLALGVGILSRYMGYYYAHSLPPC